MRKKPLPPVAASEKDVLRRLHTPLNPHVQKQKQKKPKKVAK
jgi:hypothetical protein